MPSLTSQLRLLPRSFWILALTVFVNRFGLFVWPFLTIYITRNGNTAAQAGLAVSSYSVGGLCAAGLGGWLADRIGRNVTMALAAFGGAAGMLAMSQFTDWRWLCLVAFFVGLATESGSPALSALVQDILPPEQRVLGYSVNRFAGNLGWSTGPTIAGWMAESSFLALFVIDAATSIVLGIIAWGFLPRGERTLAHRASWRIAWRSIRANRQFLAVAAACLFGAWLFRQLVTTFPLHFERSGLPMRWYGIVMACSSLMICAFEIPLANSTRHWPVRIPLGLGYLLMGFSFLLLLGASSLQSLCLTITVFTFGEMLAFSRQQAYAASFAPDDMRGRYSGFIGLAWAIGGILASTGSLGLYEQSPAAAWLATAAFGLAAAALTAVGRKDSHPKPAPAS
ncbi:MAG TPA: MFS transporter [Prosthecobacter sp.]|nr:MFS transporter [Prosthecobacter sp.]